jgi:hypothetical protein
VNDAITEGPLIDASAARRVAELIQERWEPIEEPAAIHA